MDNDLRLSNFNPPSADQAKIITSASNGNCIDIDAMAGSGKTTVILGVAGPLVDDEILQFTFNRELRLEVDTKAKDMGLTNLTIHNYHSFAVKYLSYDCHIDEAMERALDAADRDGRRILPDYDDFKPWSVIIIDEAQDMTLLYFRLVKRLYNEIAALGKPPQLLIFGDRYQSMYNFKGADPRFLTLASSIWQRPFEHLTLRETFRIPHPIVTFINASIRGCEERLGLRVAHHGGRFAKTTMPSSYSCDDQIAQMANVIADMIYRGDNRGRRWKAEDFFILAPSIKHAGYLRALERALVRRHIPVFYPNSDDTTTTKELIAGKIAFCSFHQAKGRERNWVYVFGFDGTYDRWFGQQLVDGLAVCPPPIYVALTRAKFALILISFENEEPIACRKDIAEKKITVQPATLTETEAQNTPLKQRKLAASSFSRFAHADTMRPLAGFVEELFECICEVVEEPLVLKVQVGRPQPIGYETSEFVSTISSFAISSGRLFQEQARQLIASFDPRTFSAAFQARLQHMQEAPPRLDDSAWLLEQATLYTCLSNELEHPFAQLRGNYNWLSMAEINSAASNFPDTAADVEVELECKITTDKTSLTISGRADVLGADTLWELKCTQALTDEHRLQLFVYAFLWYEERRPPVKFKLLNLLSCECWELRYDSAIHEQARGIMRSFVISRYDDPPKNSQDLSDEEFIAGCLAC